MFGCNCTGLHVGAGIAVLVHKIPHHRHGVVGGDGGGGRGHDGGEGLVDGGGGGGGLF